MKKIYASLLLLAAMVGGRAYAQTGSVTLTPPVGAPVTYSNITAAYAAIPTPLSGNYLLELQTSYNGSTETYPVQLTDKGLAAGGFTITIRPALSNTTAVIQRPVAAAGAVLQFNGADNTILDGRPGGITSAMTNYLTINDLFPNSSTNRNIELLNAANNNIVRFVRSVAADASTIGNGSRNILIGSGTATAANNNNTITNCNVVGGLRGIQDFGLSATVQNSGNIIQNDTVRNFGAIGIFAGSFQTNISILNNYVTLDSYNVPVVGTDIAVTGIQQQSLNSGTSNIGNNTISMICTSTTITSLTGISDAGTGIENVFGNNITTLSTPSNPVAITNFIVGMSFGAVTGGTAATFNVTKNKVAGLSSLGTVNFRGMSVFPALGSILNMNNNFISIMDPNTAASAIFGILLGNRAVGSSYTSNVYFNTVRIGGTQDLFNAASTYGVYKGDENAGSVFNLKNNLSVIERVSTGTSAFFIGFYLDSTAGSNTVDYNTYYSADPVNGYAAGGWDGFVYRNGGLVGYKTSALPQEQHSNFATVSFVSNTDLHLVPPSTTATALYGTPIAGITVDIDFGIRSTVNPFQGADEPGVAVPVQLLSFTGIKKDKYNQLQWTTATELNNKGFDLERSADGIHFASLYFVNSKAANGSSNAQLTYTFDDVKPLVSQGFYRLKQSDKDGRSTYSNIVILKGADINQLSIASIYPNPVVNSFDLIINAPSSSKVYITATNMAGQSVLHQERSLVTGNNIVPINATLLRSGAYIITVTDQLSHTSVTTRFVK